LVRIAKANAATKPALQRRSDGRSTTPRKVHTGSENASRTKLSESACLAIPSSSGENAHDAESQSARVSPRKRRAKRNVTATNARCETTLVCAIAGSEGPNAAAHAPVASAYASRFGGG